MSSSKLKVKSAKLLIICGPTATGKTSLGVKLAKEFDGEIVSADSRQVYRHMDIGTGKDIPVSSKCKVQSAKSQFKVQSFKIGYYEVDGIRIWLLDIVEPDYKFNVADYKKCADIVIADILSRGKLPIVVGGTGFYIKAIVDGIETMDVKPDWKLRERLLNCSIVSLLNLLREIDPKRYRRMNESDRQNPRRLIRAIEIAKKLKVPLQGKQSAKCKVTAKSSKFNSLFIGLKADYKFLYQRIDQRVDERVKQGVEGEIRALLNKGHDWNNSALGTSLAYRQWRDFFEKKSTKEEVVQRWKFDEHNYARRQITWFKKDKRVNWYDISAVGWQEKVEKTVKAWYSEIDAKKD